MYYVNKENPTSIIKSTWSFPFELHAVTFLKGKSPHLQSCITERVSCAKRERADKHYCKVPAAEQFLWTGLIAWLAWSSRRWHPWEDWKETWAILQAVSSKWSSFTLWPAATRFSACDWARLCRKPPHQPSIGDLINEPCICGGCEFIVTVMFVESLLLGHRSFVEPSSVFDNGGRSRRSRTRMWSYTLLTYMLERQNASFPCEFRSIFM